MFINLSNHPSDLWSDEQLAEARRLGEIKDVPFPNIMPNLTSENVRALAEEYVAVIVEKAERESITVHVMGEMTFTYNLVSRLKAMGIRCVASTTERRTRLDDDGNKVSEFKFVQFREY